MVVLEDLKGLFHLDGFLPPSDGEGQLSLPEILPIQLGLEHSRDGASTPSFLNPHIKEFLPNVESKPTLFQFEIIALLLSLT